MFTQHNLGFEIMNGKTFKDIEVGEEFIQFEVDESEIYLMHHMQDCCESVYIEDICGDISHLINSPIIKAEKRTNRKDDPKEENQSDYSDPFTWTFYELATTQGAVTIRWYGTSNGYYSEEVSLDRIK